MQTTQMVGISSLRHLCETVGVSNISFKYISVYLIECIPALELGSICHKKPVYNPSDTYRSGRLQSHRSKTSSKLSKYT